MGVMELLYALIGMVITQTYVFINSCRIVH